MNISVPKSEVTIANEAIVDFVDFGAGMLHCRLRDGRVISVPLSWYPTLASASKEQRNTWKIIGDGEGIRWPLLNEDLSVRGFMKKQHASECSTQQEIEQGFRQWLDIFMGAENGRWSGLSVWECDVLIDRCWTNFWANVQYHNSDISVGQFLSITRDIDEEE